MYAFVVVGALLVFFGFSSYLQTGSDSGLLVTGLGAALVLLPALLMSIIGKRRL